MKRYKDLEKYLTKMWTAMLRGYAEEFGFSADENDWVQYERQNNAPLPDATTVLTFRIDNYENWRGQRYGRGTFFYDQYGAEYIAELRTFRCVVNIMSKELGNAFDASRFVIANLQNNRYNDFVEDYGRELGIEQIYPMQNISDLENGTWTERINFEVQMNFRETILVNDPTLFVKKPISLGDLPNSVKVNTDLKK